jgi:hypothetical protein
MRSRVYGAHLRVPPLTCPLRSRFAQPVDFALSYRMVSFYQPEALAVRLSKGSAQLALSIDGLPVPDSKKLSVESYDALHDEGGSEVARAERSHRRCAGTIPVRDHVSLL